MSNEGMSEAKRRLLERRLQGVPRSAAPERKKMPARSPERPRRASLAQQSLWMLDQAADESAAYHISGSFRIRGHLDPDRLERAIGGVRDRHEILRSVYRWEEDELRQFVDEQSWVGLERAATASVEEQASLARRWARARLNPETGPLWRVHWITCAEGPALLGLTIHHLIADEWSIGLFWREVGTAYDAVEGDNPVFLGPPERQFADFAAWQRDALETGSRERQLAYWREHLQRPPLPLPLPTDLAPTRRSSLVGALQRRTLSVSTARAVRALAESEKTSVFVVSLLALQLLLQRTCAVDDVIVATPMAHRQWPETASMLGYFLSTVPLRTHLDEGWTIRAALEQVHATVFGAMSHLDLPLEEIVDAVKPFREAGRPVLAQVMLVYQRAIEARPTLPLQGIEAEAVEIETDTSKFDFTLFVAETGEGLELMGEYRTDQFKSSTIERWLEQYGILLAAVAADPEARLANLDFRTARERNFGQSQWPLAEDPFTNVVSAIARQAQAIPEGVALQGREFELSYAALWTWAGNIAQQIMDALDHPPERVGVHLSKGPMAIAAILGVLRCGAAYVPLDPAYPARRNRLILEDAAVDLLLVAPGEKDPGEGFGVPRCEVVSVDSGVVDAIFTDPEVKSESTAYLLYTSGSTGRPKGVEVTHANLWASTRARFAVYERNPGVFMLFPSLAFDSSVAGVFWTLCGGGTLVLPSAQESRDPAALTGLMLTARVTAALGIPSLYRELLLADATALRSLRRMIVAGEACSTSLVTQHFEALPDCALANEYGPTEGTVWATVHQCLPGDGAVGPVPIGTAIPGAEVHLLDAHQRPVPVGVRGEIWIGGDGVARGYWRQPALTADRFRELPGRGWCYRTGDLGRWRDEGCIDFLGRIDQQVKINGHRVELSEIEAALQNHPAVAEAVVLVADESDLSDDADVEQMLAEGFAKVPQDVLEEWILSLKNAPTAVRPLPERSVGREKFRLDLHVTDPSFVRPPRKGQRDWMLGQALEEFASDLEHLDRKAPHFVPGHDYALNRDVKDLTAARLTDQEIMEDWMGPLMRRMAAHVSAAHGEVLEIGFGRGVAAEFVQAGGVSAHVVVEMSDQSVTEYFHPWRNRYPDRDIRLHHARWQDVEPALGQFDGVLFHAFPMNEQEFIEYVMKSVTFAEHAFAAMAAHLRPGGVFTYMTTEIDSLSRRHQRSLLQHFRSLEIEVAPVDVPPDTRDTWWANSMVVIKAVK